MENMKQKNLVSHLNAQDTASKFNQLPGRIFLDTNVLQYLQDFGEYIFDNYVENDEYFLGPKGKKVARTDSLYQEIEALQQIFAVVNRAHFEFALSESSFAEVIKKKDTPYTQWFYDVLDHWRACVEEYQGEAFSDNAEVAYQKAKQDKSLLGSYSKADQKIILDAIRYDCDAILTVDFAKDKNKQQYVFQKYDLMILKPIELLEILNPFIALF